MKARQQPATAFDYDAVETAVDGPQDTASAREQGHALLMLGAILDALLGSRLSAKELAARALALGIVARHWRVADMSARDLSRRTGISHVTICKRVREIRARLNPPRGNGRLPRHKGKRAAKVSKPRKG